jgi:sulfide dehydrogenase cytochrome subunit
MQFRILAISALAAAIAVGCASQQKEETAVAPEPAPAPAKAPEKPELQMGASDSMLANTCAGCHGTFGISHGPSAPTIAGLEEDYLYETMKAYQSGDRHSTIMNRMAKGYTDGELKQIANFYSKQTYVGWTQAAVGPQAKLGHKIHENFCEKCHEDEGTSVEDVPMAGQWMPYIEWTTLDYLNGKSKAEKDMQKALDKLIAAHPELTKAQMAHSLSHFYGSRSADGYKRVPGRLK